MAVVTDGGAPPLEGSDPVADAEPATADGLRRARCRAAHPAGSARPQ